MALTYNRAKQVAQRGAEVADRLKALYRDINDFLKYNSNQAVEWAAQEAPAYLEVDADGNLSGFDFDRLSLANHINACNQIKTLLDGGEPAQGDYIGVVNQVARAGA